jgi:hypothetical protein
MTRLRWPEPSSCPPFPSSPAAPAAWLHPLHQPLPRPLEADRNIRLRVQVEEVISFSFSTITINQRKQRQPEEHQKDVRPRVQQLQNRHRLCRVADDTETCPRPLHDPAIGWSPQLQAGAQKVWVCLTLS